MLRNSAGWSDGASCSLHPDSATREIDTHHQSSDLDYLDPTILTEEKILGSHFAVQISLFNLMALLYNGYRVILIPHID